VAEGVRPVSWWRHATQSGIHFTTTGWHGGSGITKLNLIGTPDGKVQDKIYIFGGTEPRNLG